MTGIGDHSTTALATNLTVANKHPLEAGYCHSVSTVETVGGTENSRSLVSISNNRSTPLTSRLVKVTNAMRGNGPSRRGRAGALDPLEPFGI